jgi:hypothetical protein
MFRLHVFFLAVALAGTTAHAQEPAGPEDDAEEQWT